MPPVVQLAILKKKENQLNGNRNKSIFQALKANHFVTNTDTHNYVHITFRTELLNKWARTI